MPPPPLVLGIDVGGSKILGVLVDPRNPSVVRAEARRPTPTGRGELLDAVAWVADELVRSSDGPVGALGIGLPGLVDRRGVFRYGPHVADLVDVDVRAELERRLEMPVAVDNDATCAARGEFAVGAGAGADDAVMITLGTGIGVGLLVDGAVRVGSHGFAGEAGHITVERDGEACPCGRRGCWERYASGSALGRLGREAVAAGRAPGLSSAVGDVADLRGEHVVAAALRGDTGAAAVLDDYAGWIAVGLVNLVAVLDSAVVVLGGGVVDAADVLHDRIVAAVRANWYGGSRWPIVPVVIATRGSRAGALGAAVLATTSVGAPLAQLPPSAP